MHCYGCGIEIPLEEDYCEDCQKAIEIAGNIFGKKTQCRPKTPLEQLGLESPYQ